MPPPVVLTTPLNVTVVPSGSTLFNVKSTLVVGFVSSSVTPVSVSFPWLGGSFTGVTVTNNVSFTQIGGSGVPLSHTV